MAKVLVIGGAGYVGSSTLEVFLSKKVGLKPNDIWILDDFSTGHPDLLLGSNWVRGQLGNRNLVRALLRSQSFDVVFHFAAKSIVSESFAKPEEYFQNNVHQTRVFLEEYLIASKQSGKSPVFVFSSTCAIFKPIEEPQGALESASSLNENSPLGPSTPYGETKLQVEQMLEEFSKQGLRAVSLRYFNAAGAVSPYRVGEWHSPETHLIPSLILRALNQETVQLFGTNHSTPDGTCVRDYIHVQDLGLAHWRAYEFLREQVPGHYCFNLGSEKGFSVREVLREAEKVFIKHSIAMPKVIEEPARRGDIPMLIANSKQAQEKLNFKSEHQLSEIIEDALLWELNRKKIPKKKAVFFDRDETLNPDHGYMGNPDLLELFSWVPPALKKLKNAGFALFVVSNQSGVGRGLFTDFDLERMNLKLNELLQAQAGFQFDGIFNCVHSPDQNCNCRKPSPKMILEAAKMYRLDLSSSFMIGDRESDFDAGKNAGLKNSFLLKSRDQASFDRAIEQILKHD